MPTRFSSNGDTRLCHVIVALAAIVLLAASCSSKPLQTTLHHENTNVIWLTICTLRADHLGAAGYAIDVSPNIDRMAGGGVFFDRVLTAAPWTRASIASMITGVYPRSLGIEDRVNRENNRTLLSSYDTAAELFRSAGYSTIGITANPNTNRTFNFQQGYDYYEDTEKLWRNGYDDEKVSGEEVFASLLEQLRGPFRGKKFFAHAVIVDVHIPYLTETAIEKTGGFEGGGATPEYDLQIRYVDTIMGELMEELAALGLENTLIVLTSDHGEGFRQFRRTDYRHGKHLYNSTIWTPLLLLHPSLEKSASHHTEVIESVDILPTVLDLLGMSWDSSVVQGRSLKGAVLDCSEATEKEFGVVETSMMGINKSAILGDGWKLIVNYETGESRNPVSRELYRFAEDPLEKNNQEEQEEELTRTLFRRLGAWQDSCDARIAGAPQETTISDEERRALEALGYLRD